MLTSVLLPGLEVKESSYPLWNIVNIPAWTNRIVSFLLFAGIGYFLIELNNTFAIIRMRASVQTSLYFLLITACPGMHLLYAGDVAAVTFLISLYFLFKSYQQPRPAGYLFHSFALLSAGSVAFPQLTYFIPIWLMGASGFQSLTFRSFCGAIIGWSIPYWFLLGHAFFHNEIELFYQPFIHLADFRDIDFGRDFQLWEVVTLGYLFILYIVSSIHCIVAGYEDKIRTRAYLHFLIFLNFCIFLFIVLQPALSMNLLSLLLIGISILVGHLFVLTNSKSSNLFFIGSMITLIALFCFNIWTLL
ncbi:putative membrane protein [Bacteroides fragilis str. 20793-3]|nr:putative membrane protein [Bacteroides fragilis str. 20793-3]